MSLPSDSCATVQNEAKFYLIEDIPKFTKFMREPIRAQPGSAPLDTPGYFVAGIVKGYLESAGFQAECATTTISTYSCPLWSSPLQLDRAAMSADLPE